MAYRWDADKGWRIDVELNEEPYQDGFASTNGDGTVPLLSLGYMCRDGWRSPVLQPIFNPSGMRTVVREYAHNESLRDALDPRGGEWSVRHVEIIGHRELLADVLHIAAGKAA